MDFISEPELQLTGLRHGFFTRQGGVSKGFYESLNADLRSKDDPAHVAENLSRMAAALGGKNIFTVNQTHSNITCVISDPTQIPSTVEADALVTNIPGISIGVTTADCAPILFYDPERKIIGAAHAGWRGAFGGILDSCIAAMEKLGSKRQNIIAALGPCIHMPSYEVGADFHKNFLDRDSNNSVFFEKSAKEGHFQFDLPGYVLARLLRLQLGAVHHQSFDTCAREDLFFSHRRRTLRGEPARGSMMSAIRMVG